MKNSKLYRRVIIDKNKCDRCRSKESPVCTEACPYNAVYPDANSNYIWIDCELTQSPELCLKCIEACPNKAIEIKEVPEAKIKARTTVYFENSGIQNTEHVVNAISNRLKEDDIQAVVVASCSGSSALLLAKVIKNSSIKIINISVPKEGREKLGLQPISGKMAKRLSDIGVICREQFFSVSARPSASCVVL